MLGVGMLVAAFLLVLQMCARVRTRCARDDVGGVFGDVCAQGSSDVLSILALKISTNLRGCVSVARDTRRNDFQSSSHLVDRMTVHVAPQRLATNSPAPIRNPPPSRNYVTLFRSVR